MQHPFLDDTFQIRWSTLQPSHIEGDIRLALAEAIQAIQQICEKSGMPGAELSYDATFGALSDATRKLSERWGKVTHLDAVCNSPELREAHKKLLPEITDFYSGIALNSALWKVLKTYGGSDAAQQLDATRRRHVQETMDDFIEQGADLTSGQKEKVKELQKELAELTQQYSENVLDATNAWELIIEDENELKGLPEQAIAAARANATSKGYGTDEKPAWRFTLQAPSLIPVLTYAASDALRKQVWTAFNQLCSEGQYATGGLIKDILIKRAGLAALVGKASFADLMTERRMVGSGQAAIDFVETMHQRIKSRADEEMQALQTFKARQQSLPETKLDPWESGYWAEKLRVAEFDFDEELLRPYFSIGRVISGMFTLAERVFKLHIKEVESVYVPLREKPAADETRPEVWHPDVKFYEVRDAEGNHLGSFYADWHPRESKRGGAWMNYLRTGEVQADGTRTPHLGLICGNLTEAVDGKPALLTHNEVETIFHEFGHLLHHLCGEVTVPALNGVNVAWDFVELPSQIMENWCWERESLDLFARHFETDDAIPDTLFERMLAARNFMAASATMRQLSFCKIDLALHTEWVNSPERDLIEFSNHTLKDYTADWNTKPLPNIFHFSHLFASTYGYACGYYSYKWAEVLDADAFTRFQNEGILSAEVGCAFREKILAKGNSANPADLFRDFMGRDPDPDALLRRAGLL